MIACGAQQRRRILLRRTGHAILEDGALLRLATELSRQLDDGAPVRDRGRHVRPLPLVRALGEEASELVERLRMPGEDSVRMLVDEADAG